MTTDREALGRKVRTVWVTWAREQPNPKPSWLVPWEDLDELDREVDRRIGETLYAMGWHRVEIDRIIAGEAIAAADTVARESMAREGKTITPDDAWHGANSALDDTRASIDERDVHGTRHRFLRLIGFGIAGVRAIDAGPSIARPAAPEMTGNGGAVTLLGPAVVAAELYPPTISQEAWALVQRERSLKAATDAIHADRAQIVAALLDAVGEGSGPGPRAVRRVIAALQDGAPTVTTCRLYQRNLPEDPSCYVCGGRKDQHRATLPETVAADRATGATVEPAPSPGPRTDPRLWRTLVTGLQRTPGIFGDVVLAHVLRNEGDFASEDAHAVVAAGVLCAIQGWGPTTAQIDRVAAVLADEAVADIEAEPVLLDVPTFSAPLLRPVPASSTVASATVAQLRAELAARLAQDGGDYIINLPDGSGNEEAHAGRFHGLYHCDGFGEPLALFADKADADRYLARGRAADPDGDDYLSQDWTVLRTDAILSVLNATVGEDPFQPLDENRLPFTLRTRDDLVKGGA